MISPRGIQPELQFAVLQLRVQALLQRVQRFGQVRRMGSAGLAAAFGILPLLGRLLAQRRFLRLVLATAQHRRNRRAELPVLQRLAHRVGDRFRFVLVRLRGGEHHHEKGEQQSDEIGVRDQPAFVILRLRRLPARQSILLASSLAAAGSGTPRFA